jgi:hypothetical protein
MTYDFALKKGKRFFCENTANRFSGFTCLGYLGRLFTNGTNAVLWHGAQGSQGKYNKHSRINFTNINVSFMTILTITFT